MAIARIVDETKGTVVLTYAGDPITPEMNVRDPNQILDVLTAVINSAYNKLRDAGLV
jgi:hypothetical protein